MTTDRLLSLETVVDVLRRAQLLVESRAPEDLVVSGVAQDSRQVRPGDLFLAWRGTAVDAHRFVPAAAEAGARAAVVERFVDEVELPQLLVRDGRRAAALAAHTVLGRPSERLHMTAVTGTNGKTTVTFLARHLLAARGRAAALGTLGLVGPDGEPVPETGGLTTPGPVALTRRLADLADAGVTHVALEASSHALEQRRLDGLRLDTACFTNLSRDHLDYHGTLDAYRGAKAHLLELLEGDDAGAVMNGDDPAWSALPDVPGRLLVTRVGSGGIAFRAPPARLRLPDLRIEGVSLSSEGSRFQASWGEDTVEARLPLLGDFNVENAAVALGAALLAGLSLADGARALADAPAPPGRLEVTVREPVPVILDYAHTPDALRRVLETLRPLYAGRLIVVFGAGGDRDRTKRPEMGRVAARGADVVVVTSDNPRTEDPETIVAEVAAGVGDAPHHRITDRRAAIKLALELARPGDAVLLAGKGHETYQVMGTETRPFDERVVVRELLAGRSAS